MSKIKIQLNIQRIAQIINFEILGKGQEGRN